MRQTGRHRSSDVSRKHVIPSITFQP